MTLQDTTRTASRNGELPVAAPPTTHPHTPPGGTSYYGHPIIKEPTWSWEIPVYFVTGGISGLSSGLSLAARLSGNHELARRAQLAAMATIAPAPVLLISDLGYPKRFYNMLRLVKPSSPMSIGSWVMTAASGTTAVSTLSMLTGRAPWLGRLAGTAAALLGLPLSTYTAVLITNTSVPIWHEARHHMPYVFSASSSAGAGALSTLLTPHAASGPARRLAMLGAVLEVASSQLMDRHLGGLAEPLHTGRVGRQSLAAKLLTGAGAAMIGTLGRRSATVARVGAGLMLAGVSFTRWSIFRAGFASARDPRYTVDPQRRRREAGSPAA
ncbi:MAG TPA: NrfD/PsrC family molybdoenzyme membrane anchor subunit [Solirubrobacteraceae bacterium]|nr:NrfD/PsrC family molybdoenzyme membrane anchor subunit [Solirubrobacteraceae bacterium]